MITDALLSERPRAPRCHLPRVLRCHLPRAPRCHLPKVRVRIVVWTVRRCHLPRAPRCHRSQVPRCHLSRAPRCHRSQVLRCHLPRVRRCHPCKLFRVASCQRHLGRVLRSSCHWSSLFSMVAYASKSNITFKCIKNKKIHVKYLVHIYRYLLCKLNSIFFSRGAFTM